MTERITRTAVWEYMDFVLTSAKVAEKGHLACWDTSSGEVVPGAASTTLLPIGQFHENLTGDGVKKVAVRLFQEIRMQWWDNDTGSAVAESDQGSECYIKDSHTVTMDSSGKSKAGRVMAVHERKGVLVLAGLAVTGPTGPSNAAILGGVVADRTALKALLAATNVNGKLVELKDDGSMWRYAASSTIDVSDDPNEQLVIEPDDTTGRWIRADKQFTAKLPVAQDTADAEALLTVPTGFVLKLAAHPFYDVAVAFSGGSSSSIGASLSKTGYSTKGDIIGATLSAALGTGIKKGTLGDKLDSFAEFQALFLEATDEIRHDRIVDDFTTGSGFLMVPLIVCKAPASA
jgi:hypothetical protein